MIYFKYILYFPLLLRFLTANNKALIIKDLYANNLKNRESINNDFIKRISVDRYFRTLFYFRTRSMFTNVLRVLFPKERYFIIDVNSKIGGGLRTAHPYGTIINADRVGENVYINQLVTIGEKNGKRPVIEDNVELHANCCIIGGVTIGMNAIVGAGTVVTKDVPANSIVVGAKMRFL